MQKSKLLFIPFLSACVATLIGCASLHIHDQSSKWEHDETSHWQVCSKCGEKFNVDSHTFNSLTDKCLICDYLDPVFVTNDEGIMTRLTAYGKTKGNLNPTIDTKFRKVSYIGDNAFEGAQVVNMTLPKELVGVSEKAFTGLSSSVIVKTEEEVETGVPVEWIPYDGYYYKYNKFGNSVASVNGVLYYTLKEAFDAIEYEDSTITLLKENLDLSKEEPIEVKHRVVLESFYSNSKLKANFNIASSGVLKILPSIDYRGKSQLMLQRVKEQHGKPFDDCYTSGSLVFAKRNERPSGISVHYVDNFDETEATVDKIAVGSKQSINEALVIPVDYYAFGVYKFSFNFDAITGLTAFGETVTGLTLGRVVEDIDVSICKDAFHRYGEENIEIKIIVTKKINIHGEFQKGKFHDVIIGEGVTTIGEGAFSTEFDSGQMSASIREAVALVTCPLYTIKISDSVSNIGYGAFRGCGSLTTVIGGKQLWHVYAEAFKDCFALTTVDFSMCGNLQEINERAFLGCNKLSSLKLQKDGWEVRLSKDNYHMYPTSEMTPENCAFLFKNKFPNQYWQRLTDHVGCCVYQPNDKDSEGHHWNTDYFSTLKFALDNEITKDDSYIFLTNEYGKYDGWEKLDEIKDIKVKKSAWLDCESGVEATISNSSAGNPCLTISPGKYLIISDKIHLNGDIVLERDNNGAVGGFAYLNEYPLQNKVIIKDNYGSFNTTELNACNEVKMNFNGKVNKYTAYGMINFVYDDNVETFKSMSSLGHQAIEFKLENQVKDSTRNIVIGREFSKNNNTIENITLGKNIVTLNEANDSNIDAFSTCNNLKNVDLEEGSKLETIGRGAFFNCEKLESVDLRNTTSLKTIGRWCFQKSNIQDIYFNETITTGWKTDNVTIDANELKDSKKAAELLRVQRCGQWNRTV